MALRMLVLMVGALAVIWLLLVVVLFAAHPDELDAKGALRLLPDTLRLVRRLASDRSIPVATRLPVWLLLAYLVSPIDVVPDFVPVIGYADDAILTSLVLRRLVRRAGPDKLAEHWPGTTAGLDALRQLLRVPA